MDISGLSPFMDKPEVTLGSHDAAKSSNGAAKSSLMLPKALMALQKHT